MIGPQFYKLTYIGIESVPFIASALREAMTCHVCYPTPPNTCNDHMRGCDEEDEAEEDFKRKMITPVTSAGNHWAVGEPASGSPMKAFHGHPGTRSMAGPHRVTINY